MEVLLSLIGTNIGLSCLDTEGQEGGKQGDERRVDLRFDKGREGRQGTPVKESKR